MANSWLRLWHDMPTDPKWRTIARVSGQPVALVQAVYIHLLVSASQSVTRGHADVTIEDLASHFDVTERDIGSVIDAMQGRVLDGNYLTGWERRQPKREDAGDSKTGAKSAAQRKREQRERQRLKQAEQEQGNRQMTEGEKSQKCHAKSHRVTTDKDKDKDKDPDKDLKHTQRARESPVDNSIPEKPGEKFRIHSSWQPDPGFRQRSETWGRVLTGPDPGYTAAELTEFCTYWTAEGVTCAQVQWEQKFSLFLMNSRASAGRRRGNRLVGDFSSMDYEIPNGFNGR